LRDWIGELKSEPQQALKELYNQYRAGFILWIRTRYVLSSADAEDLFQDVVIIFFNNVRLEKITNLEIDIKTYLYAIGKNLASKIKRKEKFEVDVNMPELTNIVLQKPMEIELTDRQRIVAENLKKMGDPCRGILKLFYFDRLSMDEIAVRMEYKNEHVVKSQKLRCLKKLRTLFENQKINNSDL